MANEITSANAAQAIVKLVAAEVLPALMSNLIMGQLVNRNYESVLQKEGDVVNVPIAPAMSSNNIAEAGSVINQNPSLGNAQVVLNTHSEATFVIPDATKVLASPDLMATYLSPAAIALAESIEGSLLNLYQNLTANTAVGTGATPLTEATVDAAEKALFVAKVPQSIQKHLVVGADAYSDLRQIERFSEVAAQGSGSPITTGTLGKIKDFLVYRSQLVKKPSTTTYNLAFAPDAFALVTRRMPIPLPGTGAVAEFVSLGGFGLRVVMSYASNTLSQQFTVDVLYGCAVLRNVFGLQVLS